MSSWLAPPPPPPSKPRVREVATRDMGELADGSRLHVFEKRQVMGPALSFEVERHWKEVGHWEWEPGTGCFVALKGFDFEKQAPAAADAYDERFKKLWRFYLGYCEAGFRAATTDVHQIAAMRV